MGIQKWTRVGEPVPATPVFFGKSIVRQEMRDPRGKKHEFFFYALKDSVVVMPVTSDGHVLVVREYKQGSGQIQEALVGGYRDERETFEEAASREVREETGHEVGRLVNLGWVWIVPRHSNGAVHLYLALDCKPVGELIPDEAEEMELLKIPLAEWIATVVSGVTKESFSAVATVRALPHLGLGIEAKEAL